MLGVFGWPTIMLRWPIIVLGFDALSDFATLAVDVPAMMAQLS